MTYDERKALRGPETGRMGYVGSQDRIDTSDNFGPVWEGWGFPEWALVLGLFGLLLGALFVLIVRPKWFSRVEAAYEARQERQVALGREWMDRAEAVLGEDRAKRLSRVILAAMFLGWAVGFGLFFSERGTTPWNVFFVLAAAIATGVYVILLRLDAAAYNFHRPWLVLLSWVAAAFAIIGLASWELLDPTEEESFTEGVFRTLLLGVPGVVFFLSRWKLRRGFTSSAHPPAERT
jgi:hypothetical protein